MNFYEKVSKFAFINIAIILIANNYKTRRYKFFFYFLEHFLNWLIIKQTCRKTHSILLFLNFTFNPLKIFDNFINMYKSFVDLNKFNLRNRVFQLII